MGHVGTSKSHACPKKQGKFWARSQVLSLLNATVSSLFFLCRGWPMLLQIPHCKVPFSEFRREMGKNPSDWAFPSINSTPLMGISEKLVKAYDTYVSLCFFLHLGIFLFWLYWIIRDSHYPSSSIYPKLLFQHSFLCLLCTLDNIKYLGFESDSLVIDIGVSGI